MKLKLHHIGLVSEQITKTTEILSSLGFKNRTLPTFDPIQKVTASFVDIGDSQDLFIELLEPSTSSSPISSFLKKRGSGLHHLCFEVNNIEEVVQESIKNGFSIICPPVECIGYDEGFNRECKVTSKIAFIMLPNRLLIEFLQKGM